MAIAHQGLNSLTKYLRNQFPWQRPWYCEMTGEIFEAEQVRRALFEMRQWVSDEDYLLLGYRWLSIRSRDDIAFKMNYDSSTVKRIWDRLMNLLKNRMTYDELIPPEFKEAPPTSSVAQQRKVHSADDGIVHPLLQNAVQGEAFLAPEQRGGVQFRPNQACTLTP